MSVQRVTRSCPDCQLHVRLPPISLGQELVCPRCSALLKTVAWQWRDVFILWFSGVLFWGASMMQPLLSISVNGQDQGVFWWQLASILWHDDALLLSLVIALTTIVAPSIYFLLLGWVLFPKFLPLPASWSMILWQWLSWSRSGLILEVFFLGILVSAVKLSDVASISVSWSFAAFIGLMLVVVALSVIFDAREHLHEMDELDNHAPEPQSLHAIQLRLTLVWSLLLSALILYIPANLLPMMTVTSLGKTSSDTIMDGVVHFLQAGQWHLALVIFMASIFVPLTKLLVLIGLLLSYQFGWCNGLILKTKAYRFIRVVGVWSMVDIFVITLLVALVQFDELAQVQAGSGALAFLGVVLLTLVATHLFHSHWLWARCEKNKPSLLMIKDD